MTFWALTISDFPTDQTFYQFHDLYTELDLHRIMSGFHGAFATGVASQQGTLTLPDTWFRPPFWDLLVLQLLRPDSSNLPCLYSTFHLEYPWILSRFCFQKDRISIFWTFSTCIGDGSGQFRWILTYQRQFLDVIQSVLAVWNVTYLDVIWIKRSSGWVSFLFVCPISGGLMPTFLHETIAYLVSNWFMNIKMKCNISNVETSFRHVNHSASFVSGRLLRFHIPKCHQISVTCWCLLPSDTFLTQIKRKAFIIAHAMIRQRI